MHHTLDIEGTDACGKTTLINKILANYPHFKRGPDFKERIAFAAGIDHDKFSFVEDYLKLPVEDRVKLSKESAVSDKPVEIL
ncbi:MAG: hypothetical protein ACMXYF_01800 [Candidatus Woesearchaeota archaeon]